MLFSSNSGLVLVFTLFTLLSNSSNYEAIQMLTGQLWSAILDIYIWSQGGKKQTQKTLLVIFTPLSGFRTTYPVQGRGGSQLQQGDGGVHHKQTDSASQG